MGAKQIKSANLNEKDLTYLINKTGLTKNEIIKFYIEYNRDNPYCKLDCDEFMRIYKIWLKKDFFKRIHLKS